MTRWKIDQYRVLTALSQTHRTVLLYYRNKLFDICSNIMKYLYSILNLIEEMTMVKVFNRRTFVRGGRPVHVSNIIDANCPRSLNIHLRFFKLDKWSIVCDKIGYINCIYTAWSEYRHPKKKDKNRRRNATLIWPRNVYFFQFQINMIPHSERPCYESSRSETGGGLKVLIKEVKKICITKLYVQLWMSFDIHSGSLNEIKLDIISI